MSASWRVRRLQPSTPAVQDDDRARAQGLYDLAQKAFIDEQTRYDAAEVKTARYLTVLALVLGATAFKIDDLLWVMKTTSLRWYWELPFGVGYATTFLLAFAAILMGVRAMSVEELGALPLDSQVPDLFSSQTHTTAQRLMAEAYFTEARDARDLNNRRSRDLRAVRSLLAAAFWAAACSVICYLPLRWTAPYDKPAARAEPTGVSVPKQPANVPTSNQTPPTTTPAVPPKFDHVSRGDTPTPTRK
jgi:hypothetical protein